MPASRQTIRRLRPIILMLLAIGLGSIAARQPNVTVPLPTTLTDLPRQAIETLDTTTQTITDAQPGLVRVTHVVDGDTMRVELGGKEQTVRFLGIDTPETHDPRKPVQCFGEAAANHSRTLLEGKNVKLEPDPQDSDKDKYGRLLRYVYLPDGTLVNARLIADGYAFAYTVFPLAKLDEFRSLEADARQNNRGLWAGCNIDDSKQVKQTTSQK